MSPRKTTQFIRQAESTGVGRFPPTHLLPGPIPMNTNPSEKLAAELFRRSLQKTQLEILEQQLDQQHPVDSEDFLEDLTTGRLSQKSLLEFRSHLETCVLCSDVVAALRDQHPMPWLDGGQLPQANPAQNQNARASSAASALELARERLAPLPGNTPSTRPAVTSSLKRTVALIAAVAAAVLILTPAVRTLLQPAGIPSTFATLTSLADFGLATSQKSIDSPEPVADFTAVTDRRRELKNNPASPVAKLNLAAALLQARLPADAKVLVREVLETQPGNPEALNALGLICAAQNNYRDAAEAFQQAAASDRLFTPATLNLADVLLSDGQRPQAIAVLTEALLKTGLAATDKARLQQRLDSLTAQP